MQLAYYCGWMLMVIFTLHQMAMALDFPMMNDDDEEFRR